jgi:K+-transporting ATPase c subunit
MLGRSLRRALFLKIVMLLAIGFYFKTHRMKVTETAMQEQILGSVPHGGSYER